MQCWAAPANTAAWYPPAALHAPQHSSRCRRRNVHTNAPLRGGQAVNLLCARLDHSAIHHLVGRHTIRLHLAVQLEGLLRISRSRAGCNPKDSAGRRVRRGSALPPCFSMLLPLPELHEEAAATSSQAWLPLISQQATFQQSSQPPNSQPASAPEMSVVYRIESILRPAACSAQQWDSGQSANMHQHLRCIVYHLPQQSARPWCDHPTNKTAHSTPHSTCSMSATCMALRRSPASAHTRSCGQAEQVLLVMAGWPASYVQAAWPDACRAQAPAAERPCMHPA